MFLISNVFTNRRFVLSEPLQSVSADCEIGPFVTISPAFTLLIENKEQSVVTGFICGALDSKQFNQNAMMCWWPTLVGEKYAKELFEDNSLGSLPEQAKATLKAYGRKMYNSEVDEIPEDLMSQYPSPIVCCIWPVNAQEYYSLAKRLATVLFAALRSCGSFGAHTWIEKRNGQGQEFHTKLGFTVVHEDIRTGRCMLGRKF